MPRQTKDTRQHNSNPDLVRTYLSEIGQIPLLSAEEEIQLAKQIQALCRVMNTHKQLKAQLMRESTEEEWAQAANLTVPSLKRIIAFGKRAKDKMIESNLRLVVSIAKKYQNQGLSFLDLIQEGSLGLVRAAEKFNPKIGNRYNLSRERVRQIQASAIGKLRSQNHLYELPGWHPNPFTPSNFAPTERGNPWKVGNKLADSDSRIGKYHHAQTTTSY